MKLIAILQSQIENHLCNDKIESVLIGLTVIPCIWAYSYWCRRKLYASTGRPLPAHGHLYAPTPTNVPIYAPPITMAPFPAPPPYCEAARPSYEQLYDALVSGRPTYDFYDRRHPNAYYDRYFLPDVDSSSNETASLISYRMHRSCSSHFPWRFRRGEDVLAPPPYYEVTAKPELYPLIEVKCSTCTNYCKNDVTMASSWPRNHRRFGSGCMSPPDGSKRLDANEALSQADARRGHVTSPLLLTSPASSVGLHTSELSSLPPTSPHSPPAPTSPSLPPHHELRDVLRKINQLPRAMSPNQLSPGLSPTSPNLPSCSSLSYSSRSSSQFPSCYFSPRRPRRSRPFRPTLSLDTPTEVPHRPHLLPLGRFPSSAPLSLTLSPPSYPLPSSCSTPNLGYSEGWFSPPNPGFPLREKLFILSKDGTKLVKGNTALQSPLGNMFPPMARKRGNYQQKGHWWSYEEESNGGSRLAWSRRQYSVDMV